MFADAKLSFAILFGKIRKLHFHRWRVEWHGIVMHVPDMVVGRPPTEKFCIICGKTRPTRFR